MTNVCMYKGKHEPRLANGNLQPQQSPPSWLGLGKLRWISSSDAEDTKEEKGSQKLNRSNKNAE